MLQRAFMIILILGLHISTQPWVAPEKSVKREPQSLNTAPNGTFYLASGTDGCPSQINWLMECQGFVLDTSGSHSLSEGQRFCHINKGPKVFRERLEYGTKKLLTEVVSKDNMIRKKETTTFSAKGNSVTLEQEDTVIFDETGKFLWEHSNNGKGFSCLYSR
ncbi:hypothetical protein [Bdellovibrio sp.]|uniref:hypothetical protein n=1 Tax=Bdellovibrio sp. TaxID=28201 RepID=UPI0039E38F2C